MKRCFLLIHNKKAIKSNVFISALNSWYFSNYSYSLPPISFIFEFDVLSHYFDLIVLRFGFDGGKFWCFFRTEHCRRLVISLIFIIEKKNVLKL